MTGVVAFVALLRRVHLDDAELEQGERELLDRIEAALAAVSALGMLLTLVMIGAVVFVARVWHATLPVALGVTPFCVSVAAQAGLALIGRGEFPGGG
jgi:hypothetical protein